MDIWCGRGADRSRIEEIDKHRVERKEEQKEISLNQDCVGWEKLVMGIAFTDHLLIDSCSV